MSSTAVNRNQYVTLGEASTLLRLSKATVKTWENAGKLSVLRHPAEGHQLYDLNELINLQAQLGLFSEEARRQTEALQLDLRGVRKLITRLHNILRDSDSQSNIVTRFDELTKLLFAKVASDKTASDRKKSPFTGTDVPLSVSAVREYYKTLALQYKAIIPKAFSEIQCSDNAIVDSVAALRLFDFASASFDVKGMAYEEIIRKTFDKGDHQQFFTPPHVVDFMVSLCAPFIHGDVCDPASGTGGFLVSIARKGFDYSSLTSIEIDERLSWVSGINLILHEAERIRTVYLPNGGTLGQDAESYFSCFDTIITNPPFGSDFSDKEALSFMELGVGRTSRRRGILFLERCHKLLRENGTLAIILDEGVLNLSHAADVRRFLTSHFDLKAVVSLPETTFMPYASVTASILILQKRISYGNSMSVFYARADAVGRKPNGDEDIRYQSDGKSFLNSDLPTILDAWDTFRETGELEVTEKYYVADVVSNLLEDDTGHRLDFQFHHPARRTSRDLIEHCKYSLSRLGELCVEKGKTIIPSTELVDTIIPYTGLAHIASNTGYVEQVLTPANSLKSGVKMYNPGDIVFAKMRPNLRKIAWMDFEQPGYVSAECCVLTVREDAGAPVIDPLLLSVLLRTDVVYGQILHLIAGIGRPRIGTRQVLDILIPVPPKDVQEVIKARYLRDRKAVEDLKEAAKEMLANAERLLATSINILATEFVKSR